MRRHHLPEVRVAHPNVTPLIDVVMCLIIFFMLIAKIGVSTGAEEMVIPKSILGTNILDMGNTLTLNVRAPADERTAEPTIAVLLDGSRQELKRGQLVRVLRRLRYGPGEAPVANNPQDNPNFSVNIRAEEDLPYRYLQPVLEAAAEANVRTVNFNTRKEEGVGPAAGGSGGTGVGGGGGR